MSNSIEIYSLYQNVYLTLPELSFLYRSYIFLELTEDIDPNKKRNVCVAANVKIIRMT